MVIKYAGPKVMISAEGVDFDNNKEDSYVYLNIAIQFLLALDLQPIGKRVYHFDTTSARLSDKDLMDYVRKNLPESERFLAKAQNDAELFVEYEKEQIEKYQELLSEEVSKKWRQNIDLMKPYVTQRHFNKSVYHSIIDHLVSIIKDIQLEEIHTPMYQKFIYVFSTLQETLNQQKETDHTQIVMYEEQNKLMAKLII